jgi:hypothetical protein
MRRGVKSLAFHILPSNTFITSKFIVLYMPDLNCIIVAWLFNASWVWSKQSNGDFTAKECQVAMNCLLLKVNVGKNVYDNMSITLGDSSPFYFTAKNWVARFRTQRCVMTAVRQRDLSAVLPGKDKFAPASIIKYHALKTHGEYVLTYSWPRH